MTTPLEDRITAALDQMARAAVPDEAFDHAGISRAGTSFESQRVVSNPRPTGTSGRLLAIAACAVLICAGVIAIVAWSERTRDSTSLVVISPSISEAPQSQSTTPASTTPAAIPPASTPGTAVEPTTPEAAADLTWMIDPAVAGSQPLRPNHLKEWVEEESYPPPTYAYSVSPDGTFIAASWQVFASGEWDSWARNLPPADGLTSLDGLEVRREVEGENVNVIMMRANNGPVLNGISITFSVDQEAALSGWIQAAAVLVQANGAAAAPLIVAPPGYTVIAEVANPITLTYWGAESPESEVTTRRFSGAVDPKAWIAAVYPDRSIADSVVVDTASAWRLSAPAIMMPDGSGADRTTVVWQPTSDTLVELTTKSDPDKMLRALRLVPFNDPSILESSFTSMNSSNRQTATNVLVEVQGETPIGRFGYQAYEDQGHVCNAFMLGHGGGGGGCDTSVQATRAPDAICAAFIGGGLDTGARAFALVNAADAGFVEIRRSAGDADPVTPEVFTGESNGHEWALVTAHFDDPPGSVSTDIRFTGGSCQPG